MAAYVVIENKRRSFMNVFIRHTMVATKKTQEMSAPTLYAAVRPVAQGLRRRQ